jgi:hypothetical protein
VRCSMRPAVHGDVVCVRHETRGETERAALWLSLCLSVSLACVTWDSGGSLCAPCGVLSPTLGRACMLDAHEYFMDLRPRYCVKVYKQQHYSLSYSVSYSPVCE